ncbi:FtsX-like permease family protein [soil metagenome]
MTALATTTPAADPTRRLSPSIWMLALRQLGRDFRAGELRLLVVAVLLAVAALTAVGFFADRLNRGLARDAAQLIGGDVIIASDQPTPATFTAQAQGEKLAVATTANFPSMGRAPDDRGGGSRLVSVKAVSGGYPLRGQLRVKAAGDAPERAISGAPAAGTVWVDEALLESINLRIGDQLLLGDASLKIAQVIAYEPDRGMGFMSFSPRVMLNAADLPSTGLVQPASRVTYRLAVASPSNDAAAVRRFTNWAQAQVKEGSLRGLRIETLEAGRPEMRQTLARAEKFLNLVALLSALLAAVAVAIASRDFAARHLDDCAMLRVLGLSQRTIASAYLVEFGLIGLAASAVGVVLGFAVHYVFVWLLASLVGGTALPMSSGWPALFGVGVGLTLLMGFGLPPVLQLASVPPVRVIRRDVGALKGASVVVLAAGTAGFAALLMAVSSDFMLAAIAVGGFAAAVVVFALLSWLAVQTLRRAVPESRAPRWLVLATRQIAARPAFAVLQVSALSVGLLALVLLVLLRTDLIASWRQATPPDAPNRFVINVQPDQADAFRNSLRTAGVTRFDWYPMIRGRLEAINGEAVNLDRWTDARAKRLVDREFNLSNAAEMPSYNRLVGGKWTPDEADGLSVEEGLAETLGLKLGDSLRFNIAGVLSEGRITSLRKVDWGSMHANFFVMFPRDKMPPELAATYIAAFRAPAEAGFDNKLSRDYPNVTNVNVSASLAQIQGVLDHVIRAVEFLFGFTLLAGLVVLFAAITATREARSREFAIMRALGASASLLRNVQRAELLGVGALAGLLASLAAVAVGWALARFVFEFSWTASPLVPVAGTVAGALLALSAGWLGLREVLRRPVVETLRTAAQ